MKRIFVIILLSLIIRNIWAGNPAFMSVQVSYIDETGVLNNNVYDLGLTQYTDFEFTIENLTTGETVNQNTNGVTPPPPKLTQSSPAATMFTLNMAAFEAWAPGNKMRITFKVVKAGCVLYNQTAKIEFTKNSGLETFLNMDTQDGIIFELPKPTISVTGTTLCAGETGKTVTAALTNVPDGCTIDWGGNANITTSGTLAAGATSATGNIGTGLAAGTYSLTAKLKNASGTVVATSAAYTVTVNAIPSVTITPTPASGEVCEGLTLKLKANVTGATGTTVYAWTYTGTGTKSVQELSWNAATTSLSQTFSIIVTVNGCKSTSVSQTVTVNPKPTVTLAAQPTSICKGVANTVTLTATSTNAAAPATAYTWSSNASALGTGASGTVTANSTQTYEVTPKSAAGCTGTKVNATVTEYTVGVTINGTKSVNYDGSTTLTAAVGTLPTGITAATYSWTPTASIDGAANAASMKTANLKSATEYTVEVTDSEGCKGTNKATVTVSGGALAVNPSGGDKLYCTSTLPAGGVLSAGDSGGSGTPTYEWTSSPAGLVLDRTDIQSPKIQPTSADGTYTVTVKVTKGSETLSKTLNNVKVYKTPEFGNISISPSEPREGESVELTLASVDPNTASLSWSGTPLASTSGLTVSTGVLTSGGHTYTVEADNNGCKATKSQTVNVGKVADLVVTPPATTPKGNIDEPFTATVTVSGGDGNYEYEWKAPAGVTITGEGATATITSSDPGPQEICVTVKSAGLTEEQCFNVMVVDPNALTLNWTITEMVCQYPGETRKINIMASGGIDGSKYSFALSAPDGSSALTVDKETATSWELEVTADKKGTYQLSNFSALLPDGSTMNGTISPGQDIDADFYKVPAVHANGVVQNSTLDHCAGEELVLSGSGDATEYIWDNGVVDGQPFVPTVAGIYTVTGTNEFGCSATDQVTVNLNPKPSLTIALSGSEICPGEEVTLNAEIDLGTVTWNNGVTNGEPFSIEVSGEHTFTVTAIDSTTGCSISKDTTIVVKEKPVIVTHSKNPRNIAIGKDVYFAVKAAGGESLTYEWYRKTGDEWSLLENNDVSLPMVSGATTDSLILQTVPESWDGSELKIVVKNDCDTASMIFELGVKECFEVEITMSMQEGIIPDTDPTNKIDGWYCRGRRIALRAVLSSPEGYDIENAHFRWTIDGLDLPEEHVELETDTCVLTWIPEFQEDDMVVKVCGYSDGACEEVCSRYLRLKAREYEKVSLSLLTSVDPDHRFCPGDTVDFWVAAKNVGDSARYDWYNDIFHLSEENPRNNELLSYSETKLTLVMGQEDTWVKLIVTPSQEICTEEPEYIDTVFLRKGVWANPSMHIINNIEDTVACRGDRILFTAVYEDAGTNPTFNWRKDVWDWGHEQFAEATLDDRDMWLKCWMVPGKDVCYDGSLFVDSMIIRILENPTVVISADLNNKAPGDEIVIESEVKNMPTKAHYTWYLNYDYTLSNSDYPEYISDKLAQGDVIQCSVTGERICTSEVLSNELVIYFGSQSRDTMITIYQGEKIRNLNMRRRGDSESSIFRITADGYPRWGVGSINFNGYFDYTPNAGFVGSDVVKYEVVDKFDQTKVETGYIYITVMDKKRFFIPNIITPNGDGINDTWNLDFLADYPDHHIMIYNRDGAVVFEATNYQNDWDGTGTTTSGYVAHFNLANGVYTYVIDLGNKEVLKNWIEIRRDMNRGKYKY